MIKRYYWISFEESAVTNGVDGIPLSDIYSCASNVEHIFQIAIEGSPFTWWKDNNKTEQNVMHRQYSYGRIAKPILKKAVNVTYRRLISFTEISKTDYDIACEMNYAWKDPKEFMKDEW